MLIHSPKELALLVNKQRKKLNLSQTDIGHSVGLKQTTVSAFENKPESTKLDTLFHILSAANLDLRITPKDEPNASETKWEQEW